MATAQWELWTSTLSDDELFNAIVERHASIKHELSKVNPSDPHSDLTSSVAVGNISTLNADLDILIAERQRRS